jgi:hypothetical protein
MEMSDADIAMREAISVTNEDMISWDNDITPADHEKMDNLSDEIDIILKKYDAYLGICIDDGDTLPCFLMHNCAKTGILRSAYDYYKSSPMLNDPTEYPES